MNMHLSAFHVLWMLKNCAKEGMYKNIVKDWPITYPQTDNLAEFSFCKAP